MANYPISLIVFGLSGGSTNPNYKDFKALEEENTNRWGRKIMMFKEVGVNDTEA